MNKEHYILHYSNDIFEKTKKNYKDLINSIATKYKNNNVKNNYIDHNTKIIDTNNGIEFSQFALTLADIKIIIEELRVIYPDIEKTNIKEPNIQYAKEMLKFTHDYLTEENINKIIYIDTKIYKLINNLLNSYPSIQNIMKKPEKAKEITMSNTENLEKLLLEREKIFKEALKQNVNQYYQLGF